MYNPVEANEEQIDKLYKKHISKPCFSLNYSFDNDDDIGFFSFTTLTGKRIEGQLRGEEPMFVDIMGFGDTRYDIYYPSKITNKPMYERIKYLAHKCRKNFLKGSEI